MTTFATVNWKNYLGRGVEYANVLYDSIRRNLKDGTEGRFVVFTDDVNEAGYLPGIELRQLPEDGIDGWYNKLQLFHPKAFTPGEQVVFFDLDTMAVGPLDEIAAYRGPFAILRDVYRPNGLQSSVMLWEAGKHEYIWEGFKAFGFPKLANGDQEWIERSVENPVILQREFPHKFVSYKRSAQFGIPPGSSVVFFHGLPRPHECDGWVKHLWKVGAATSAQLELVTNTDFEAVTANVKRSELRKAPWLQPSEPHYRTAIICAGGPSLKDEFGSIKAHYGKDADIFACNAVPRVLKQHGIDTDFHVILDARPENVAFTGDYSTHTMCLYASQCDEAVHDAAGSKLILWHAAFPGILDIVGADKPHAYIGGGTTCGMKAACLAWAMGYRKIHLYGFDSCYRDGEHHAYPQSLNDKEQVFDVEFGDKTYKCASWMIQQANDFEMFGPQLIDHGVELHVHGTGLIPDIAAQFSKGIFQPESADFRAMAILERLQGVESPKVAEIGVFAGDLSRRLLARRPDLQLFMVDAWAAPNAGHVKQNVSRLTNGNLQKEQGFGVQSLRQSASLEQQVLQAMSRAVHAGMAEIASPDGGTTLQGFSQINSGYLQAQGQTIGANVSNMLQPQGRDAPFGLCEAVGSYLAVPPMSSHDPWIETGDFHASLTQETQDQLYRLTQRVTSFAGERARIIKADSAQAASLIEDNSLDMAFIDADHSYEGCRRDIEAYYPKVKPGGIIAGHDYANDDWKFGPLVKRAVDEFVSAKGLDLDLGENYTWFAVKPNEVSA